jgi:hypothetical protein
MCDMLKWLGLLSYSNNHGYVYVRVYRCPVYQCVLGCKVGVVFISEIQVYPNRDMAVMYVCLQH